MKYILLALIFITNLPAQMINHSLSAQFMPAEVKEACEEQLQDRLRELIAQYPERAQIEAILKGHANLAYHRLSHAFLRLREQSESSAAATREFENLKTILGDSEHTNDVIDALNDFNNFIYTQHDATDTAGVRAQFDKIFEGLMNFSQAFYGSDPEKAHLALQPGDRHLLLNFVSNKNGSPRELFSDLAQEMNIVLSQRNPSIGADASIQENYTTTLQNRLNGMDKEKVNDFLGFIRFKLNEFVNNSELAANCKAHLSSLVGRTQDHITCVGCEDFREILNPTDESLVDDIFKILNQDNPADRPDSLRVQGPRFSGCKITEVNGEKRLVLENIRDIPVDRGDDPRAGSTFWIDNCSPQDGFAPSATEGECQSYRENGSIKIKNDELVLHNPNAQRSFDSMSFPLLDSSNETLYIRNDWTSGFARPINLAECDQTPAPQPSPTENSCQHIHELLQGHMDGYQSSYTSFTDLKQQSVATKEECEAAKTSLVTDITALIQAGHYQGNIDGIPFTSENQESVLSNCGISCDNYQQNTENGCYQLELIKDFLAAQSSGSQTKDQCTEKLQEIKDHDFSALAGTELNTQTLPSDAAEITTQLIEICELGCDHLDPCNDIKAIMVDDDGTSVIITSLDRDKIKAHFENNWDASAYPDFADADAIMNQCFPEETPGPNPDQDCANYQDELDDIVAEFEVYDKSACDSKRIEIEAKALTDSQLACELECREATCDDWQKVFEQDWSSEDASDEDCKTYAEEMKDHYKDNDVVQDCEFTCKKDDDDDDDDSDTKDKEFYPEESIPQSILQNMYSTPPTSTKVRRIRGSGY